MNFSEELAMAGELELTDSELETVGGGHRRFPWWWWRRRRPDYDDYYWPYSDWDGGYFGGGFGFEGGGGFGEGHEGGGGIKNWDSGAGETAETGNPTENSQADPN